MAQSWQKSFDWAAGKLSTPQNKRAARMPAGEKAVNKGLVDTRLWLDLPLLKG